MSVEKKGLGGRLKTFVDRLMGCGSFLLLGFIVIGVLYGGAQLLYILIFPQSKRAYSWVYKADADNVHIEKKPHDCKFMTAPIGNKHCRYERVVSVEKGSGVEIWDWDASGNLVKVGVRPRKDSDNVVRLDPMTEQQQQIWQELQRRHDAGLLTSDQLPIFQEIQRRITAGQFIVQPAVPISGSGASVPTKPDNKTRVYVSWKKIEK